MDLTPFFNQYLRRAAIPCTRTKLRYASSRTVLYKWQADEPAFAMPVKAGDPAHWQTLHPTRDLAVAQYSTQPERQFQVATDLFYINVSKTVGAATSQP